MLENPFLKHKLRLFVSISAMCAVGGVLIQWWEAGFMFPLSGLLIGGIFGLVLASFEATGVARFADSMPFWQAVVLKAGTYVVFGILLTLVSAFLSGLAQGLGLDDYVAFLKSGNVRVRALQIAGLSILVVFLRQLDRLLGPGRLVRYMTGYYRRPRREDRIFMFLDLTGATAIAETLSVEQYFDLLQHFFADLTGAVIASGAEIYQYVGDEAVLSWKRPVGLKDANCVWAFALFGARIHERRQVYMDKFGLVPEFKAGLHGGAVVAAEIGDLRKDLVYSGDVLNTTARIEGICNRFEKRLVASKSLVDALPFIPPGFEAEGLGPVRLSGKDEPVELVALA